VTIELATGYVSIVPSAKDFGKNLESDVDGPVARSAGNAESKFGGAFKKIAVAAGGLFAAKLGVDFLKDAIGGASDLNETISKSNTIFGSAASGIEAWANRSDKAIGQSKQQALDAAATYGNLFVQLGIGSDKAAGMSTKMVELASDFASFHNADIGDVIEAQTAAFRGEYDAVQRFVPTINAAAVEQRALADTHKATTKELTAQDKALAVQKLLMEGAGAAAGDFARTSNGLANKQRIFAAQMDNLKAKIGQALLPVMTAVTAFLSDRFLPGVERAGQVISKTVGIIGGILKAQFGQDPDVTSDGWVGTFEKITIHIRAFAEGLGLLPQATGPALDGVRNFAAVIREKVIPVVEAIVGFVRDNLQSILIALGVLIVGVVVPAFAAWAVATIAATWPFIAIAAAVAGAILLFKKFPVIGETVAAVMGIVQKYVGDAIDWVKSMWPQVSEAIGHVMVAVQEVIERVLAVVQFVWRNVGDDILNIVDRVFHAVYGVINGVLDAVRGLISTVLAVINGDWGKAWDSLLSVFRGIWDAVYAVMAGAVGVVRSIIAGIGGTILGALGNVGGLLLDAGKSLIEGFITGIKNTAGRIITAIKDAITDKLPGFVKNALGIRSPSKVFMELGRQTGKGFELGLAASVRGIERAAGVFDVTPAFTPSPSAALASGAGSFGLQPLGASSPLIGEQNIYAAPGQSPTEIGRISARETAWAIKT
jgi:hypothetical protein